MNEAIYIKVQPERITYVNKIMEGYEHLGMVSTIDRKTGVLIVRVTPDTYDDVKVILRQLPIKLEFV